MGSILYDYTREELQNLLDKSSSYSDVLRKVGIGTKGGNPKTLKRIIKEYDLDETQLNKNRSKLFSSCAYKTLKKITIPLEDILNGKHLNYQSSKLLKRLVEEGYKEYKCEICGLSSWNDKEISLQLHHKNGEHFDNSLNNLQILCPNCHSQTDSFGGKSSRKKKGSKRRQSVKQDKIIKVKNPPLSRDELKNKIRTMPFVQIGKEYTVTDNAVRKWCVKYDLPNKVSVIKAISDENWIKI